MIVLIISIIIIIISIIVIIIIVIVTTMIVIPMSGDRLVQDDLDARVAFDQRAHPHSLWGAFPHLSEDFEQGLLDFFLF